MPKMLARTLRSALAPSITHRAFSTAPRVLALNVDSRQTETKSNAPRTDGGLATQSGSAQSGQDTGAHAAANGENQSAPAKDGGLAGQVEAQKQGEKDKQTKGGSGSGEKRGFHTSARWREEHPGYVSATKQSPAAKAGYNVPGEANPSPNLYDRPPPAPASLKPTSELKHSSTAQEPAHPVLAEQAKTGELADRNPMPDVKTGEIGLDDAWKNRNAELKK